MKLITKFVLILLVGATVPAQTPPQPSQPDLTIKRVYWSKRAPFSPTEPWPFFPQYPTLDVPLLLTTTERPSPPPRPRRQRGALYTYSAQIKNGAKALKAVAWDFVFADGGTGKELGRHSLLSFERIGRNRTASLTAISTMVPLKAVRAKDKDKTNTPSIKEHGEPKCILYADDSTWCQPNAPPYMPDLLRRMASRRR